MNIPHGRTQNGDGSGLRGLKVLIAEDQAMIALDLTATLTEFGCVVLPAAPSNVKALAVLRAERPDAALLDVSLADGSVLPVAEALAAIGVPFAVLTGHDPRAIGEPALRAAPYLAKPCGYDALRATMGQLAAMAAPRRYLKLVSRDRVAPPRAEQLQPRRQPTRPAAREQFA